jgi:hypothetical protein
VYELGHDKLMEIAETEQNIISEMYENVIQSVFNVHVPKKKIIKAIKEMLFVEKAFKDPYGIKKKALASLDNLIYGVPLYSSIIFPLEVTDGLDYLNLKNSEWCLPFDKNQKSTLSFIDLFNEAYQKTQRFCDVLFSSIYCSNSSIPYALKLFGNNSYTSGIDCEIPVNFRYHDIIFKNSKKG